jgi:BTB/POZ domain
MIVVLSFSFHLTNSSVDLEPYMTSSYGYDRTKFSVTLEGLKQEFRTPGKYQLQVTAKIKDLDLMDPEFKDTDAQSFRVENRVNNRQQFLNSLSPSGSLFLDVNVVIKLRKVPTTRSKVLNPGDYHKQMAINNSKMLDSPQFSDFKFIVKSKEFKVHRAVLAAASPVFAKMFTADMEEARSSKCNVDSIEPEIFEHLLRFIYGGKLPEVIGEVSMKLFEAAHYYDITQLKEICEQ